MHLGDGVHLPALSTDAAWAEFGLQEGDTIVSVNDEYLESTADFIDALAPDRLVVVEAGVVLFIMSVNCSLSTLADACVNGISVDISSACGTSSCSMIS